MNGRNALLRVVFVAVSLISAVAQPVKIAGADTLIFLGQRFVQQYEQKHSGQFSVTGGGTAAAKTGEADVLQSEGAAVLPRRVLFPVAVEAIVVYVNSSNPVKELSLGQLRRVFMGEITNWKELGGPDLTIHLYAGESTTGTLAFFQQAVLHDEEPYPFVGKSNTKALLEVIATDRAAIGYGSLDENPSTKSLPIKAGATSLAVAATIPNIRSLRYPLTRHIYWSVPSIASQATREFCAWVLSSEGQLVAEGAGFEPVLPGDRSAGLSKLGIQETTSAMASGR